MRISWVFCFCFFSGLAQLTFAQSGNSQPYSQWDPQQTVDRDVAFVSPSVVHANSNGTSLVLEVKEAVNYFNGLRLKHRAYNGNLTGPTIRVRPGSKLRICLINNLPNEPSPTHDESNTPHGFNNTNLHTHGLHVSPKSPSDNVFLEITPNTQFDFEFEIAADHPAGTFWYHPHKHGSTAYQLASGMAGALIVEGGLDNHPGLAGVEERVMVLQQFVVHENPGDVATVNVDDVYQMLVMPQTAINGQVTPTITMRPGEIQRWRLIHAGIGESLELSLAGVPLYEIAVDGLALGTRVERSSVLMYPGYRSDVLVKAPAQAGTYLLNTALKDAKKSLRKRIASTSSLLKVIVAGEPKDMPLPSPESFAPYAPFTDADVPTDQQISGRTAWRFRADDAKFTINDVLFDPAEVNYKVAVGNAEEWTINGAAGGHPFHVHVNPFAVPVSAGDANPNKWLWRDTLFVEDSQSINIRSWFRKHTGKTVLHCHILDHEDQGMMQVIEINEAGGAARPVTVPGSKANERINLRSFRAFNLLDASKAKFDGNTLSDGRLLLILHRGFGCTHCAQQIRELATQIQWLEERGIRVVAVSQELPAAGELNKLRDAWSMKFPVLSDPDLKLFQALDCAEAGKYPLHGAFYFDREGVLKARHVGEEPLMTLKSFVKSAEPGIAAVTDSPSSFIREGE